MNRLRSWFCIAALPMLWSAPSVSDTVLVRDIFEGPISGYPTQITSIDGVLYMQAQELGPSRELWRSDGTQDGTVMIKDIVDGPVSSRPESFVVHRNKIYFIADGPAGDELWTTNGTAAGTKMVADINPGPGDAVMRFQSALDEERPPAMISVGNFLFFAATDGASGVELWRSNGTEAGTRRVRDIYPGPIGSISAPRFAAVGNTVFFFAANNLNNGIELWKSDGTAAGTALVKSINTVPGASAFPSPLDTDGIFTANDTHVFFRGHDGTEYGLYASDGSNGGTIKLLGVSLSGVVSPNFLDSLTVWNDLLYFRAQTDGHGGELWVSDGSKAGTKILRELRPSTLGGLPSATEMLAANGYLYFGCATGGNSSTGIELCRTDGTRSGTELVKDIEKGSGFSSPTELIDINGLLFFTARTTESGRELYRSDGTHHGTYLVEDLVEGNANASSVELTKFGRGFVHRYNDRVNGEELFRTCCDSIAKQSIVVLDDTSGNNAQELASFRIDPQERMEVRVHDAKNGVHSLTTRLFDAPWREGKLLVIQDAGQGGGPAFAVTATRDDGRSAIQVVDAGSGNLVGNLYPWSAVWQTIDTVAVPGAAANSRTAVATLSLRSTDGAFGVDVRDPANNQRINWHYVLGKAWLAKFVQPVTIGGQAATAILGIRRSDGRTRVQVYDALSSARLTDVYPIPVAYRPVEFKRVPDLNGNGADELATRRERTSDGLTFVDIHDSQSGARLSRIRPIGGGNGAWRIVQIEPFGFGGTPSIAVLAIRKSDNRATVRIQDADSGTTLKTIWLATSPWEFQREFQVVLDFNGNGYDELAVPFRNADDGRRRVQVFDGQSGNSLRTINLPK